MGSLTSIVIKLSRFKNGEVRNLHKFKYLIQIFKTFVDARKHSLTSNLILFRPIMKVKSINKCEAILNYKQMILFIICQSMWSLRVFAIWFAERRVIFSNARGNVFLAYFFVGNNFHTKKNEQNNHYSLLK